VRASSVIGGPARPISSRGRIVHRAATDQPGQPLLAAKAMTESDIRYQDQISELSCRQLDISDVEFRTPDI